MIFSLPDDGQTIAKIVDSIPDAWEWVDGYLMPSTKHVVKGAVARTAGIALSRFHSIHPTIDGPWNQEKQMNDRPDIAELLIEGKLPLFVRFDEAGYQERTVSMAVAKRFASHFIGIGYRGWLTFCKSDYDNCKHENPARCRLVFGFGCLKIYGDDPESVELEWTSKYRGKPEDIEPMRSLCLETLPLLSLEDETAKTAAR